MTLVPFPRCPNTMRWAKAGEGQEHGSEGIESDHGRVILGRRKGLSALEFATRMSIRTPRARDMDSCTIAKRMIGSTAYA